MGASDKSGIEARLRTWVKPIAKKILYGQAVQPGPGTRWLYRAVASADFYVREAYELARRPDIDQLASKLVLLATRWAYIPWIEEDVDLSRSLLNFDVLGTTLIVVETKKSSKSLTWLTKP